MRDAQRKILRIRVPSQILECWMSAFGSKGDVLLSSSDVCSYPNIKRRSARVTSTGIAGGQGDQAFSGPALRYVVLSLVI
jgi:hypothetical protein